MRLLVFASLLFLVVTWWFEWRNSSEEIYDASLTVEESIEKKTQPVEHLSAELALNAEGLLQVVENIPKKETREKMAPEHLQFLQFCEVPLEEVNKQEFDEKDLRYLWSRRCLYELGHQLTAGLDSAVKKAEALVEWIHLNVNASAIDKNEWLGIMPGTLLLRGYGICDRTAQLFAEIGRQIGLETALYIFRTKEGVSPHTIAAFYVKGNWYFADTLSGLIYRTSEGQPLSYTQAQGNLSLLKHYKIFRNKAWLEGFAGGSFYWVYDYRAMTKRMYQIEDVMTETYPASYYLNFVKEAVQFDRIIPSKQSFQCWKASTRFLKQWDDPEQRLLLNITIRSNTGGSMQGRLAQVSGFPFIALDHYQSVTESLSLNIFYRAQCHYDLEQFEKSRELFQEVLSKEDIKRVHKVTHMYLGLIEEQLGNRDKARAHWLQGPQDQERVAVALKRVS